MIDKISVIALGAITIIKGMVSQIQWLPHSVTELGEYVIVLVGASAALYNILRSITWIEDRKNKKQNDNRELHSP